MTPEEKKKREEAVLSSLYDRLFDAVTYAPQGKEVAFRKNEIYFQMAKNMVINPGDFADMVSPVNPNGDLRATAAFSELVDKIPKVTPEYATTEDRVSDIYRNVITQAVCATTPNPEQFEQYKAAYDFLNVEQEVKVVGGTRKKIVPSDSAVGYDDGQAAYISAVGGYRNAYNGYDLTKKEDQREWNAVAPGLQLNIDKAWNQWRRGGKEEVEEAQKILSSTINDALRTVIEDSRRLVGDQYQMAPIGPFREWLPSYASPSNWCASDVKGTKLKFSSSYLNKSSSTTSHSYATEFSARWGLWHGSGEVGGKHGDSKQHMDAQNFTLEAELILVSIRRPWFNPLVLTMKDWYVTGYARNGLSDGNLRGALPMIPSAFVVAKDVKITADFSEEDKRKISHQVDTKAEGGWGPFSIAAKYSYGHESEDFTSRFDGGSLQLPGFQIVAWINAITPPSPPEDPK